MMQLRRAAALAVIVATALLPAVSVLLQLEATSDWYRLRDDPMSVFDRRYAPLRTALGSQTVVGYLAPTTQDSPAGRAHFYMSRYALAPVQVVEGIEPTLVVADGVIDRSRLPGEFSVRRDFGGGLLLLERTEPKRQ